MRAPAAARGEPAWWKRTPIAPGSPPTDPLPDPCSVPEDSARDHDLSCWWSTRGRYTNSGDDETHPSPPLARPAEAVASAAPRRREAAESTYCRRNAAADRARARREANEGNHASPSDRCCG